MRERLRSLVRYDGQARITVGTTLFQRMPRGTGVMVVSCRGGMLMLGRQAMCLALDNQDHG